MNAHMTSKEPAAGPFGLRGLTEIRHRSSRAESRDSPRPALRGPSGEPSTSLGQNGDGQLISANPVSGPESVRFVRSGVEGPGANRARLLVVDAKPRVTSFDALPSLLGPGDVVVVNDAATFPGSIFFEREGVTLEARLFEKTVGGFKAVLFGPGDFHTRTEHRAPPPRLEVGERLRLAGLDAVVSAVDARSHRLVELAFEADDAAQWGAVYRHGHVVQYAHQPKELPLWAVQNVYGERPWAAELPSAGHHLTFQVIKAIEQRGATVVRLTHATGLSATGDNRLRTLPREQSPARLEFF